MNSDLKIIKKYYGEKMMHLCRKNFSTILETPGLLPNILLSTFYPSRYLYEDIVDGYLDDFIQLVISRELSITKKGKVELLDTEKSPKELLDEAGYNFFECHKEEEIQEFKKYYQKDEELCTFRGGRLAQCYVFFAVSKNIDSIKRKDYPNPRRDDKYGTSIMSIQFTRTKPNTLSIKNRYNHTVNNPDATYSNNLEKIIPGLTKAFEKYYNLVQSNEPGEFDVPTYIKASDNLFYKYNFEINNTYYCPDNIIIENFNPQKLAKERYILMENYILDLKEKTIKNCFKDSRDSFPDTIKNIKNISVTTNKDTHTKKIEITVDGEDKLIIIELNKYNEIISYENLLITKIGDYFLKNNTKLKKLSLDNVVEIGSDFLQYNEELKKLSLDNVVEIGSDFLQYNEELTTLQLPKVKKIRDHFLLDNTKLKNITMANLEEVGKNFCCFNREIKEISFPNLKTIGNNFFADNIKINKIYLPKTEKIGDNFLKCNDDLEELVLPNTLKIGNNFLLFNQKLNKLILKNLEEVGRDFLRSNEILEILIVPRLKNIGSYFLFQNKCLKEILLDSVVNIDKDFMYYNESLTTLYTPKIENRGRFFMRSHPKYKKYNQRYSSKKEKINLLSKVRNMLSNTSSSKRNTK